MNQVLNIAIFGLSLKVLDQMKKQILLAVPAHVQIKWVNIAEQKIDLLLVNDMFFSSDNIQRIIQQHARAYLRLIKQAENAGLVADDRLAYPFTRLDSLTEWMQEQLLDYAYEPPYQALGAPFSAAARYAAADDVFNEMFTPRNGYIQLLDSRGFVALVDTMTERVWVKQDGSGITFNETLNQTYATNQFAQDIAKELSAQDLRVWLWRTVNRSNGLVLPEVKGNQYFKLQIWPQFEKGFERRNLLKKAACFAQGAQLKAVAAHLAISPEMVEKFVAMAVLLRLGQFIEESEAGFAAPEAGQASGQMQMLRGFFGKLRKKLGL